MDIQRLRQTLSELNPIFWNAAIDSQVKDSKYPNRSPIQSAEWRCEIAMKDLHHNTAEKKHFDKLFKEVGKCLTPYDRVFDVLRKEFTSLFAEQVLLSNEKLIKDFAGVSTDNCWSWMSFVACMSHEDFWADLASKQKKETEKPAETEQKVTLSKFARTIEWLKHVAEKGWQIFTKSFWEAVFD